jgi:hypothetical protein
MSPLLWVTAVLLVVLLFAAYAYVLDVLVRLIGKRMSLKDALLLRGSLVGISSVLNPPLGKKDDPFGW